MTGDAKSSSTAELLDRAKRGECEAVEELFRRQLPQLRARVHGRLPRAARGAMDTEDVIQEALIRFLKLLRSFEDRGSSSLNAYLHTTVRNLLTDEYRRWGRQEFHTLDSHDFPQAESPLSQLVTSESMRRYVEALQALDEEDRLAVLARLHLELPYAEIADHIGAASADAVRMRVSRTLFRIAENIRRQDDER